MAIGYGVPCPKGPSRKTLKGRKVRAQRKDTAEVRAYVFARERNICRCCRKRKAESMHELVFRSVGGKRSRQNSVAVCGSGTTGCHGHLQRHAIRWGEQDGPPWLTAEGVLFFYPRTAAAREWMCLREGGYLVSPPMQETEMDA